MNKLYNRIITKLADEHVARAWLEGYTLGLTKGKESTRKQITHKLESLEVEKFNDTALTLGFNTALELVKESK
jgi:hypothetical protein